MRALDAISTRLLRTGHVPIWQLFELSHTGPISEEMRSAVEAAIGSPQPGTKAYNHALSDYGVHYHFQSGVPADEPYRVLLMGLRRRLWKTQSVMNQQYLCEQGSIGSSYRATAERHPDVITREAEILEPLELMCRSARPGTRPARAVHSSS